MSMSMLQLVPVGLALGCLLALGGLGALAFGVYALARGGRDQRGGGLGGFSERDIHAIAGLRMVAGGEWPWSSAACSYGPISPADPSSIYHVEHLRFEGALPGSGGRLAAS